MLFFTLKKDRIVRPPVFLCTDRMKQNGTYDKFTRFDETEKVVSSNPHPDVKPWRRWHHLFAEGGRGWGDAPYLCPVIPHQSCRRISKKCIFKSLSKVFLTFIFTHLPWVDVGRDALCLRRVMMTSTTALHCKLWSYMVQKCVLMESQTGSLCSLLNVEMLDPSARRVRPYVQKLKCSLMENKSVTY